MLEFQRMLDRCQTLDELRDLRRDHGKEVALTLSDGDIVLAVLAFGKRGKELMRKQRQ